MKLRHGRGRAFDAQVQAVVVHAGDRGNFYVVSIKDNTCDDACDEQAGQHHDAEELRRSDHIRLVTQRERDADMLSGSARSSAWQTAGSYATDDMYADVLAVRDAVAYRNEKPTQEQIQRVLTELAFVGAAEHWLIDSKKLKIGSQHCLGEGGFGIVWKGELSGSEVAVKMPKVLNDEKDPYLDSLPSFLNELRALRRVRHPNATLFHGALVVPHIGCLLLVSELVVGENLQDLIKKSPPRLDVKWSIALDVCKVLRFMHSLLTVMVHGDLKGSNVMVEIPGMRAKLLDFGLARIKTAPDDTKKARIKTKKTKRKINIGGSWSWAAPEIISVNYLSHFYEAGERPLQVSPSADVFSFGRVLFLIFAGQKPYYHVNTTSRDDVLEFLGASLEVQGSLPDLEWPDGVTSNHPEVQSLVEALCKTKPAERLDLVEAQALIQSYRHGCLNTVEKKAFPLHL